MLKLKNILANVKRYWFLMTQLITRDFKVKYKRSVLGVMWSLLYPVLMMIVMAIVFSRMFKFKVEGINYLVYLMTGLVMWNYFAEASNLGMMSVVDNFPLINKVYIPKYIFPISKCLFVGINFTLTLIPWLGVVLLSYVGLGDYTCHLNWYYLLLPYIFICLIVFTMGIALFLSSISVFLRDVFYIYGIILTIWNYLTPVFYSIEILAGPIKALMMFNPMYHFLTSARTIVVYESFPGFKELGIVFLFSFGMFIIGSIVFKRKQDKFIYYV